MSFNWTTLGNDYYPGYLDPNRYNEWVSIWNDYKKETIQEKLDAVEYVTNQVIKD